MEELWVGKRFLRDIRECKLVNLKTGEMRYFLMTEKDIEKNARIAKPSLKIKRADNYDVA